MILRTTRAEGPITKHHPSSEELEQQLVFQKALLESQGEAALDGILLVSYEQKVLYWNRQLAMMWDVPIEVLERGDAFEVNEYMAPKAADPKVFDEIGTAIRANPALQRRDEIPLADGRIFDRWAAPVIGPDGSRLGRTVFYRDITAERRASELLQREEAWSTFIAEATTLFSQSFEVETILQQLVRLAVPTLADWCAVSLVDDKGTQTQLAYAHIDPERLETVGRLREKYGTNRDPDRPGEAQVIRDRQPLLMSDIPRELLEESAQDPEHLQILLDLQFRSAMIVPLICRNRVLGALTLISAESGRVFDESDLHRAMDLATRAAFPIDNARLYAETRVIAETLQKSFLPPELPEIAGVDISARYFPAGEGQLIGGDFYDAFRIDDRRWALVLGDVSGKGLEAATVTTLARHTIRGAAYSAENPSDALRVLNSALVEQQQTDRFCTAVYALVEPRFARVRVTISCGGHPPPYVIRNDGTVEPIDCGGTLLGFLDPVSLRDAEIELEFGDKLFLYTDGVLDIRQKRGMFGPEGLEKLLYECSKRGTEASAELLSQRLIELQGGRATDDIAFIMIGVRSSVFNVATKWSRRKSGLEDE